jgi:hypothetical protein
MVHAVALAAVVVGAVLGVMVVQVMPLLPLAVV